MQRPVIAIFGRPQGFPDKILIKLDLCPVALKGAGTRPGTCLRSVWRHNQTERDNEPQELEQTEDRSERRKFRAVSEHYTGHTLESGRSCFFFFTRMCLGCVFEFFCVVAASQSRQSSTFSTDPSHKAALVRHPVAVISPFHSMCAGSEKDCAQLPWRPGVCTVQAFKSALWTRAADQDLEPTVKKNKHFSTSTTTFLFKVVTDWNANLVDISV